VTDTKSLIAALGRDAKPVRRLRPPAPRAALWLCFAVAVIGMLVLHHGLRPDLVRRFGEGEFLLEWLGALATGLGATLGAFHLSLPGRSARWMLAPLPGLGLWLFSMGYGFWADWLRLGPDGFLLGTSFPCFAFIAAVTLPLSAGLLFLLRYAAPVRPVAVAVLATLSVAALAAAGQSMMHGLDTAIMLLIWHLGTIGLLLLLARLIGPGLIRRLYEPPAAAA
jgi:hypothetical protein